MKIAWSIAILAIIAIAEPAFGDRTAVYEARGGASRMTVEVATNGDMRGDSNATPNVYCVTRNGEGFVVLRTSAGVVVDRMADVSLAMSKVVAEKFPKIAKAGENFSSVGLASNLLTRGPTVSINGRSGSTYFWKSTKTTDEHSPVAVISDDPSLAPVGRAMALQFNMSIQAMSAMIGGVPPQATAIEAVLKSGAPLMFGEQQLTTVSNATISPSRFELPSQPENPDAIEKRIRASVANGSFSAF